MASNAFHLRAGSCHSFSQVGTFYNTSGKATTYDYDYQLCPSSEKLNPTESSCKYRETRYLTLEPTLNLSTPSNSSILSLISNTTSFSFAAIHGRAGPNTVGYDDLTVPAGQIGYARLAPNVTCVDGTLEGCTGDIESVIVAVQACAAIKYANYGDDLYNVTGTLEVALIPSNTSDALGGVPTITLYPATPTALKTHTPKGGAERSRVDWRVGSALILAGLMALC